MGWTQQPWEPSHLILARLTHECVCTIFVRMRNITLSAVRGGVKMG